MEHSGASSCSLKEDMLAMLYIFNSIVGHVNPNDVKLGQRSRYVRSGYSPVCMWDKAHDAHTRSKPEGTSSSHCAAIL